MKTICKVAAVQFEPHLFRKAENTAALLRLTDEAASAGAEFIVLPEMATTGYCFRSREEIAPYVEPIPGPTTTTFGELARRRGVSLVIGLAEVDPATGAFFNSAALIGPAGEVDGVYRKTHSFYGDILWSAEGNLGLPVFDGPWPGPLGLLVCMDGGFFETARVLALRGARVIAFPTNWLRQAPSPEWRARAAENGVYVVAADRWGDERGISFAGGSCVIGPGGEVLAEKARGDGVVLADIDPASAGRPGGPGGPGVGPRVTRRPELYHTLVRHTHLWPESYNFGHLGAGRFWLGALEVPLPDAERLAGTLPGEPGRRILVAPPLGPNGAEQTDAVAESASATGTYLAAATGGSGEVILIGPDGPVGRYRSPHLSGQTGRTHPFPTFDLPFARVGLLHTLDLLLPEPARILAKEGADIILASGPWPEGLSHLEFLWDERAGTNDLWLAVASGRGSGVFSGGPRGERAEVTESGGDIKGSFGETGPGAFSRRKDRLRRLQPGLYFPLVAPKQ